VRPRKEEPEPDLEEDYGSQSSQEESEADRDASGASDDSQSGSEIDEDEQSEDDEGPANPSLAASQISFGALAKAAASLPSSRKKHRGGDASDSNSDDDDGDSAPEEFDRSGNNKLKRIAGRAHKHAPAEMTSKRPVTRRRQVVEVHKPTARDPRFGPPIGSAADAEHDQDIVRRNYSFLNSYRDTEMAALRTRMKKTKDPFEKQRLERELMSTQSRKQAQERKDAERKVVEEHRRQEKELVKQGKNPFYLKKSEQKKRVLVERFQGMKKRQVDKAIVRKRKKETAKERKELPMERRAR
jgi:ribosomal RNA-processing protein 36